MQHTRYSNNKMQASTYSAMIARSSVLVALVAFVHNTQASYLAPPQPYHSQSQFNYMQQQQQTQHLQQPQLSSTLEINNTSTSTTSGSGEPRPPVIAPFAFSPEVKEAERTSVMCTISSGDLPVTINWLKDGQLLTSNITQAKKVQVKLDHDSSTLKFGHVRLDHAGNYTCVAKNRVGIQARSAQLIVLGEPRWVREPSHEPIVATRGQTIVIDCLTTGWPEPRPKWHIKTHSYKDFVQLSNTSRIYSTPNGSLIIHNASKSDEANYRCSAYNGIGKGISWSTSLKVNVPAHFESNTQQKITVRKQKDVQLRCDAYGDEPLSIEWFKNKQKLSSQSDPDFARYQPRNNQLQNHLISVLLIKQAQRQDNSLYECVARNSVGRDRLPIELIVQEEPENIQSLQAAQINSRSVSLAWTDPYDGRSPITSYIFQYKKMQAEPSAYTTSDMDFVDASSSNAFDNSMAQYTTSSSSALAKQQQVNTLADDWQQAQRLTVPISAQSDISGGNEAVQRSVTIEKLDSSSRYVVRALAVNAIGQSKFSQPMEFTTLEEAPDVGPTQIRAHAINSTAVLVSWDEVPKSKQLGRFFGYYVRYRVATSNYSAAQNFINKPYIINNDAMAPMQGAVDTMQPAQRLEMTVGDLRRDTLYEITVVAFNARGSGPSSDFVTCRTIEMEPPKPVKIKIQRESNDSIFIEWQRDPSDQNPVDDYDLYQEKNFASQEFMKLRLPGNQTHYRVPGLKCGTRYSFYIIANNKVGKSEQSQVVSASTSGAQPTVPSKTQLIKMVNSTCLLINLNSFKDNDCRIKTFTVRYRAEKTGGASAGNGNSNGDASSGNSLMGSNSFIASHAALTSSLGAGGSGNNNNGGSGSGGSKGLAMQAGAAGSSSGADWITKLNARHLRTNEEDRMEYLCDLNPEGLYTIHVAASNDVGRSDFEDTVLMSSDELRPSLFKDALELIGQVPNVTPMLVFILAGLFMSLVSLILYTTIVNYYQKFVIIHNQMRATRRAKQDEKRRRKLNGNGNSRSSPKIDLWADEYDEDDDDDDDDEDNDDHAGSPEDDLLDDLDTSVAQDSNNGDDEDEEVSSSSTNPMHIGGRRGAQARRALQQQHRQQHRQQQQQQRNQQRRYKATAHTGHYLSNISNSAFDTSSIDSPCNNGNNNKYSGASTCMSTASIDSIHNRFQCLNAKQYVKMNEYTMLPSISATLNHQVAAQTQATAAPAASDIYGTARNQMPSPQQQQQQLNQTDNQSMYYSTLRRSNMQTYLPPQQQRSPPQQQHHLTSSPQRQSPAQMQQHRPPQPINDIYGYYMGPPRMNPNAAAAAVANQTAAAVAANEAANSIYVPAKQIIYSAPNIRRHPVFL